MTLRMERERCSEGRGLGMVALLAVFDLPRDERAATLGQVEDLALERLPVAGEMRRLNRCESSRLGSVVVLEIGEPMQFPPVRHALDGRWREGAQVLEEPPRAPFV